MLLNKHLSRVNQELNMFPTRNQLLIMNNRRLSTTFPVNVSILTTMLLNIKLSTSHKSIKKNTPNMFQLIVSKRESNTTQLKNRSFTNPKLLNLLLHNQLSHKLKLSHNRLFNNQL